MYKTRQVLRLLHRFPESVEQARGQSAMSLEDIGGKGGLTGKAKAQKKEDLLCMVIDLTTALDSLSVEDRKTIYQYYIIEQNTLSTPQLQTLVSRMNTNAG